MTSLSSLPPSIWLSVQQGARRWRASGGSAALAWSLVGFLPNFFLNPSTGCDDPYITYWASRALVKWGRLINYNGDPIEQSSSLLHVLALAFTQALSRIEFAVLGWGFGIACLFAVAWRSRALYALMANGAAAPAWLPGVVTASGVLAANATNGLETTLAAWVYLEFAVAVLRCSSESSGRSELVALLLAGSAMVLVRPESALVALASLAGTFALSRPWNPASKVRLLVPLAVVALLFCGLALWRKSFSGDWFPNPALAKTGGPSNKLDRALDGAFYVFEWARRPDGVVALLGLCRLAWVGWSSRSFPRLYVPLLAFAHLGFVVVAGGDWMPASRMAACVVPLGFLGVVEWVVSVTRQTRAAAFALCVVGLGSGVGIAFDESPSLPFWSYRQRVKLWPEGAKLVNQASVAHIRDELFWPEVERVLLEVRKVTPKPTIMSGQAGMVMYNLAKRHYRKFRFVDRKGLVSKEMRSLSVRYGIPTNAVGVMIHSRDIESLRKLVPGFSIHPEIVFELGHRKKNELRRAGYVIVHEQGGRLTRQHYSEEVLCAPPMPPESSATSPTELFARRRDRPRETPFAADRKLGQFIAVRGDIAKKLGWKRGSKPTTITWNEPERLRKVVCRNTR